MIECPPPHRATLFHMADTPWRTVRHAHSSCNLRSWRGRLPVWFENMDVSYQILWFLFILLLFLPELRKQKFHSVAGYLSNWIQPFGVRWCARAVMRMYLIIIYVAMLFRMMPGSWITRKSCCSISKQYSIESFDSAIGISIGIVKTGLLHSSFPYFQESTCTPAQHDQDHWSSP